MNINREKSSMTFIMTFIMIIMTIIKLSACRTSHVMMAGRSPLRAVVFKTVFAKVFAKVMTKVSTKVFTNVFTIVGNSFMYLSSHAFAADDDGDDGTATTGRTARGRPTTTGRTDRQRTTTATGRT